MNQMTAEQIAAAAKSRDASVYCVHAEGLWGKATTTVVTVDQKVIDAGGVGADSDCNIVFTNQRRQ